MHRVGIQPRMPEHGDGERRQRQRQRKAVQAGAQVGGVPFGNAGDQVAGPSERQRSGEACDDGCYLPLQLQGLKGLINRTFVEPATRDTDVTSRRITRGGISPWLNG